MEGNFVQPAPRGIPSPHAIPQAAAPSFAIGIQFARQFAVPPGIFDSLGTSLLGIMIPDQILSTGLRLLAAPDTGTAQAYQDPCDPENFQKSLGDLLQTLADMQRFGGSASAISTTIEMIASLYERCPERFKDQIVGVLSDESLDPDTVPDWMRQVRRILRERECNHFLRLFESLRADLGASSNPVPLLTHVCNRLTGILDALESGCLATFEGGPGKRDAEFAAKDIRDVCKRAAAGTQDEMDVVMLVNAMDSLIRNFAVGGVGYGRGPK